MITVEGADRWQDDPVVIIHRPSRPKLPWPPLAELAQQFDVHPNQITQRRAQPLESAAGVFGATSEATLAPVDVKALRAKIGELTLGNDFLESALTKAGLLGAKR